MYSDIPVALMHKKVFTLQCNRADVDFCCIFGSVLLSPFYQMSKPLQPKLGLILLIVKKLGYACKEEIKVPSDSKRRNDLMTRSKEHIEALCIQDSNLWPMSGCSL